MPVVITGLYSCAFASIRGLPFWNTPASTQIFAYDQAGNRTSFNNNGAVTSYTANSLNQYTAVTGATVSHNDNRGNLTGYNEWTYSYDADDRLVSATKSGYGIYFYYDAEGRLTKVNRNGTWEYRYYDGLQCFFRSKADGTWIDLMIWGPTPDELNARYAPSSGGWSFFHREPINSVDVATDIGGNVVERYLYDPFGKPEIRDSGWNIRSSSVIANPYLFTGQEWMADLGLANYKNRFYSPALGRFLQNDPIRFDGGDLNLYRYCANNPVNAYDPLGLIIDKGSEKDMMGMRRRASIPKLYNDEPPDAAAPNNAASSTTTVQILGRPIPGSLGELHTSTLIRSGSDSAVVSAQPSIKLTGIDEILNVFGFDRGATIQPQAPTSMERSGEHQMYLAADSRNFLATYESPTMTLSRPFNEVMADVIRYNQAVADARIPYLASTQNSNSYTFTLIRVLTGQPVTLSGNHEIPGSGTPLQIPPFH